MKNQSIRRKMIYIIGGILGTMIVFYMVTVYLNYQTVKNLNHILNVQLSYDSYQSKADKLQETVTGYFNHSGMITAESLEAEKTQFLQYVRQLTTDFPHAQMVDNYYIVQSYLEAVDDFMRARKENPEDTAFPYYSQTMSWYRLVLESYETTGSIEHQLISESIHNNSRDWYKQQQFLLLLGILVCIIVFFQGARFVDNLSRPIIELTERVRMATENNFKESQQGEFVPDTCRETVILTHAFEEMISVIRRQMDELLEKIRVTKELHQLEMEHMQTKVALKQTEMSLLQSLISPHFLFNCLSTLSSLAFIEKAERTEECSIQLADYLRTFLDRIGKSVTIQEEVEHTEAYLDLQRIRFGDRVGFTVQCEEACSEKKIPALLLQPLIENSLSHGLKNHSGHGSVEVNIYEKNKQTVIEVKDNGEGVDQETLYEIEREMYRPFESGERGIGLRSVAYRLKEFFDGRAEISLEGMDKGLKVMIDLP
ncbi:MAG: histidine kinase [Eubacteriales bacterium]|nr:histidine kinase [Eubacteriales bacterium]